VRHRVAQCGAVQGVLFINVSRALSLGASVCNAPRCKVSGMMLHKQAEHPTLLIPFCKATYALVWSSGTEEPPETPLDRRDNMHAQVCIHRRV